MWVRPFPFPMKPCALRGWAPNGAICAETQGGVKAIRAACQPFATYLRVLGRDARQGFAAQRAKGAGIGQGAVGAGGVKAGEGQQIGQVLRGDIAK